jgi:hypothetical protein
MVQVGPVTAQVGSRLWYHSQNAGFTGMQNPSFMDSWRLPPRFQRKAWEACYCVAESGSLQTSSPQWRAIPQGMRDTRNVEYLLRKVSGNL